MITVSSLLYMLDPNNCLCQYFIHRVMSGNFFRYFRKSTNSPLVPSQNSRMSSSYSLYNCIFKCYGLLLRSCNSFFLFSYNQSCQLLSKLIGGTSQSHITHSCNSEQGVTVLTEMHQENTVVFASWISNRLQSLEHLHLECNHIGETMVF